MIFVQECKGVYMCIGNIFGGKPSMPYIPPPPPPDPSIADKLEKDRKQGLQMQQQATQARRQRLLQGFGRRSLLSSSGAGYLTNTTQNTNLG